MPKALKDDLERVSMRTSREWKARIARAAGYSQMDLTKFVMQAAMKEADAVLAAQERVVLSEEEAHRFLELFDNPPSLNPIALAARARLRAKGILPGGDLE